jgi:hypothetical protein
MGSKDLLYSRNALIWIATYSHGDLYYQILIVVAALVSHIIWFWRLHSTWARKSTFPPLNLNRLYTILVYSLYARLFGFFRIISECTHWAYSSSILLLHVYNKKQDLHWSICAFSSQNILFVYKIKDEKTRYLDQRSAFNRIIQLHTLELFQNYPKLHSKHKEW